MKSKNVTYISMLRGINVGGQKKIRMEELRGLYKSLGLTSVRSYVQSGNVIFSSTEPDAGKLAGEIKAAIESNFGYAVDVFLRDAADFRRIVENNPFLNGRNEDPTKLHVTFLYRKPSAESTASLATPANIADEFYPGEMEIFVFCPNGYGRSKIANSFFERKLKIPTTTRNWKTVNTLLEIAEGKV